MDHRADEKRREGLRELNAQFCEARDFNQLIVLKIEQVERVQVANVDQGFRLDQVGRAAGLAQEKRRGIVVRDAYKDAIGERAFVSCDGVGIADLDLAFPLYRHAVLIHEDDGVRARNASEEACAKVFLIHADDFFNDRDREAAILGERDVDRGVRIRNEAQIDSGDGAAIDVEDFGCGRARLVRIGDIGAEGEVDLGRVRALADGVVHGDDLELLGLALAGEGEAGDGRGARSLIHVYKAQLRGVVDEIDGHLLSGERRAGEGELENVEFARLVAVGAFDHRGDEVPAVLDDAGAVHER